MKIIKLSEYSGDPKHILPNEMLKNAAEEAVNDGVKKAICILVIGDMDNFSLSLWNAGLSDIEYNYVLDVAKDYLLRDAKVR